MMRIALSLTVCLVALSAPAQTPPAQASADSITKAETFFIREFNRDAGMALMFATLRSSGDARLTPIIAALATSGDKRVRLAAVDIAGEILTAKDAATILRDRFKNDRVMTVRAKALVELELIQSLTPADLSVALGIDDDEIRLLAVRALVRRGLAKQAIPALVALTKSRDRDTELFARMTLLAAADTAQLPVLQTALNDSKCRVDLRRLLLAQIREEKITHAAKLLDRFTAITWPLETQTLAWMAINSVDPAATRRLEQAIGTSDNPILQMNLLRMLSSRTDATAALERIAKRKDLIGQVAKFELVRPHGKIAASGTADALLAQGHPIVIEYLLRRIGEDIAAAPARSDCYAKVLGAFIRTTKIHPTRMTAAHDRAARAVELLGRLATPAALGELRTLLTKDASIPRRSLVAAALYRCDNKAIAVLMAPLLRCGYPRVQTYAALRLAKASDPRAVGVLMQLQKQVSLEDDVRTLVQWYLLRYGKTPAASIQRIAKNIK